MKDEPIASLDIGSTKTVAVVAVQRESGPEIIGIGEAPSSGMRRGVITNLDEVVRSIELATERAERMAGTTISQVYLVVGGDHVRTHSSRASIAIASDDHEVNERDVARVLEASRRIETDDERHVLHALPRIFSIDGVSGVEDPVGLEGRRLEVDAHVVSGGAPMIANLLKSVTRAGLESIGMVYEPLAASAATLDRSEMMAGAMLLDVGGGSTHVALISRGRAVHTAVVPIGGDLVTSDLAMGLRMSQSEAEAVKYEFDWFAGDAAKVTLGNNGSTRELDIEHRIVRRIVQPRLHELMTLVRSELGKAVANDLRIEEIVLTGGGANLSGIEWAIQDFFGLPARIGVPSTVDGLTDDIRRPQYAAAIGLLVYGPSGMKLRSARPRKLTLAQRFIGWVGDLWN